MGQIAAIYARVSTADQSCARQVADLTDYARRAGYAVEGVYLETASGARADRAIRKRVLALAQARKIEVILVTELSRWGRSTLDLLTSLRQLDGWGVSLVAQSGMTFDLASPHGRMLATMLAGLAEFERDLIRERVRSGIAAAKARGKVLGRRKGQRPVADRLGPQVLDAVAAGRSYRWIARDLGLSKNTVADIVARHRATGVPPPRPPVPGI